MGNLEPKVRAWWFARQGLDGSLKVRNSADVLAQTGWARSVGGVGPYMTLHTRGGISREAADAAVGKIEIHELPAVRGCTYVVPANDFALALKAGHSFAGSEMKVALKLGVTQKEIDKLKDAIVTALAKGPMDPAQLREATGTASRSLGEEGKNKGLTTTMPVALGELQAAGEIRRIPTNGRLDQQRYNYALWRPNPLAKLKLSDDAAFAELARKYFTWLGPTSLRRFQDFSGLGVKTSKAAVEPLKLEPIAPDSDLLLLPEDRGRFEAFKPTKDACYALVSPIDTMVLEAPFNILIDPTDAEREVFTEKDYRALGSLSFLPNHAILDRGRLIGLWEYDPETSSIAWMSFIKKNSDLSKAIARMEEYVRSQLGDARSFGLDSAKSRAPRVAALRKASGA
jgi:hypothetical protein